MESSYSIIAIMDPAESTDLQPFSITAVMAFASVTSAASTGQLLHSAFTTYLLIIATTDSDFAGLATHPLAIHQMLTTFVAGVTKHQQPDYYELITAMFTTFRDLYGSSSG